MGKQTVLVINGEIQYHPNGQMVDICDYRNCKQVCEQGWIKCVKHRNQPQMAKCFGCGTFTVPVVRGMSACTNNCGRMRTWE